MKKTIQAAAETLKAAPMQPPVVYYNLVELEDGSGRWTFTCGNPKCQMPHLIIGAKAYVNEKAVKHTEWCGKRPAPMAWR